MPVNDSIVENDEDFTMVLNTTEMRVIVNPAVATVTIIDDDSEYLTNTHHGVHHTTLLIPSPHRSIIHD